MEKFAIATPLIGAARNDELVETLLVSAIKLIKVVTRFCQ
jgi:hypothetical protein